MPKTIDLGNALKKNKSTAISGCWFNIYPNWFFFFSVKN